MISTEIVEISDSWLGNKNFRVFTTLEGENPGGSIKDHMVLGELTELLSQGVLQKGATVSEVSAGSTAISLAYYTQLLGLKCHLFLPLEASAELRQKLQVLGAQLHFFDRSIIYEAHQDYCRLHSSHNFNQLWDSTKNRHYVSLGQKLKMQLSSIDIVIGAVGTGHSLSGVAKGIGNVEIFTAEPDPFLKVPGIRNIEQERYGEMDPCRLENYHGRLIVGSLQCFPFEALNTLSRPLRVSASFAVVLGALKCINLGAEKPLVIVALGANNSYF